MWYFPVIQSEVRLKCNSQILLLFSLSVFQKSTIIGTTNVNTFNRIYRYCAKSAFAFYPFPSTTYNSKTPAISLQNPSRDLQIGQLVQVNAQ